MKIETYTVDELMELHLYSMNEVLKMIGETKKKFVLDKDNQQVITMYKPLFSWKIKKTQTYDEVFLEDFGRTRND